MKLYAKTTSERASKGQGGNKWLRVELFVGNSKSPYEIGRIELEASGEMYAVGYRSNEKPELLTIIDRVELCKCGASELPDLHNIKDCKNPYSKGNKQKTAKCTRCVMFTNNICDKCGGTK